VIKQFISRIPPQILLLLVAVIGYWQIALLHNSLKWDMIDVVLPWRYYVSEALQNNYLPLWNPYQQMGYPIYADLQYPFWYLEQLIIGYTIGYNNYTLHFLFIFYIWLGGCGMYRLSSFLKVGKSAAFYAGIVYMLAGFMVGHVQSFTLIVGAAWVPHVVVQYLKLIKGNSFRHLPAAALFLFLLITGGYQAFTIITGYLLLALFVNELINNIKQKNRAAVIQSLKINSVLLATVIALSSVVLIVLYQLLPYANRISGMTLDVANFNPLSPQCLISLLTPFAIVKKNEFFATDISMANTYLGLTVLVFIFAALFRKKSGEEKIFLGFGTIALIASLGEYTPMREILFRYFPLLNLFRFPSIFSYFTLLTFVPIAAKQFQLTIQNEVNKKILIAGLTAISLSLFGLFVYSYVHISVTQFSFKNIFHDLFGTLDNSTIFEHVFIQAIVQLVILVLAGYALLKGKKNFFVVCVALEMILAVQFNIYYTGVSSVKPSEVKQTMSTLPSGFPLPAMRSIERNADPAAALPGLGRNTNIFRKQISFDGYTSFWLKQYNELFADFPSLRDSILKNPFVYLSGNVHQFQQNSEKKLLNEIKSDDILVSDTEYKKLKNMRLSVNSDDRIIPISFVPNEMIAKTITKDSAIFTLMQSNYYGWKVLIDNEPVKHFTSNILFMSVVLPPGEHEIRFIYSNKPFIAALIFSYLVALVLLVILIVKYYKSNRALGKYLLVALIGISLLMSFILIVRHRTDDQNEKKRALIETIAQCGDLAARINYDDITMIVNTDDPNIFLSFPKDPIAHTLLFNNLWDQRDRGELVSAIEKSKTPYFVLAWTNSYQPQDIRYLVKNKYPTIDSTWNGNGAGYICFSKEKTDEIEMESKNNFEGKRKFWSYNPDFIDTSVFVSPPNSCLINKTKDYSPTFVSTFGDLTNLQKGYLYVDLKFKTNDPGEAMLVIVVEDDKKVKNWESVMLKDFYIDKWSWNKLAHVKKMVWMEPDDKISIYVWNKSKLRINVDDIKVALYKPDF